LRRRQSSGQKITEQFFVAVKVGGKPECEDALRKQRDTRKTKRSPEGDLSAALTESGYAPIPPI
jgi:hypothetical protein